MTAFTSVLNTIPTLVVKNYVNRFGYKYLRQSSRMSPNSQNKIGDIKGSKLVHRGEHIKMWPFFQ